MIEEIYAWEVHVSPQKKGDIRYAIFTVVARTKAEVEAIILEQGHKFFDQDVTCVYTKVLQGGRRLE